MANDNETIFDIAWKMRKHYVASGLHDGDMIDVTKAHYKMLGYANRIDAVARTIVEYAKCAMCHTEDPHVLGYLRQIMSWAGAAFESEVKDGK